MLIGFLPQQSKKYVLGILQTESPIEIHHPDTGFIKVIGDSRKRSVLSLHSLSVRRSSGGQTYSARFDVQHKIV
jgi:hypothetical protein